MVFTYLSRFFLSCSYICWVFSARVRRSLRSSEFNIIWNHAESPPCSYRHWIRFFILSYCLSLAFCAFARSCFVLMISTSLLLISFLRVSMETITLTRLESNSEISLSSCAFAFASSSMREYVASSCWLVIACSSLKSSSLEALTLTACDAVISSANVRHTIFFFMVSRPRNLLFLFM